MVRLQYIFFLRQERKRSIIFPLAFLSKTVKCFWLSSSIAKQSAAVSEIKFDGVHLRWPPSSALLKMLFLSEIFLRAI